MLPNVVSTEWGPPNMMMTKSDCKFVDVGSSEIFNSMYQHKFDFLLKFSLMTVQMLALS